ncbi:MAG TPA: hypothetical protein VKZ84_02105 [Bacteriovoracaceae bacterium]|nr:hypothetical protein [Bacteriovoracaceae bacterium]
MKILNMLGLRKTILKAHNPRIGTVIIPIGKNDSEILSQYLLNKVQALQFEGSYKQLQSLITKLAEKDNAKIIKMRLTMGRRGRVLLLHLQYPNSLEVRRVIRLN